MLIVEIEEDGALRLNKIDTGTTRDTSLLAEKLEVIFADRETEGITEKGGPGRREDRPRIRRIRRVDRDTRGRRGVADPDNQKRSVKNQYLN